MMQAAEARRTAVPAPRRPNRLVLAGAGALLALGVVVLPALAWMSPRGWYRVVALLCNAAALILFLREAGRAISGRPDALLMSSRNKYSLSRLQMVGWTVLVVTALLTAAMWNLWDVLPGGTNPGLGVRIPGDLVIAMGIASFTTAATPAVLSFKRDLPAPAEQAALTAERLSPGSPEDVVLKGQVVGRRDQDGAGWLDVLRGDEVANAATMDLSKVQQLLISTVLIGLYFVWTCTAFSRAGAIAELPDAGGHFVELLAVSHAGYLGFKAVPKAGPATEAAASPPPAAPSAPTIEGRPRPAPPSP
jgi:hypothetical protein